MRTRAAILLLPCLAATALSTDGRADDVLLESATLGETGLMGGWAIVSFQFLGGRFFVEEPTAVTAIGGHMDGGGLLFGVIVRLEGPEALPVGSPFIDEEVVLVKTFAPPRPSADFLVETDEVTLEPGHYAIVYGAGLYGTDGSGSATHRGQRDLVGASYISRVDNRWRDAATLSIRFVVLGKPPCLADIDGDEEVGFPDLLILLAQWGTCPPLCFGDIDGDGVVDFDDLLLLLGSWGPCDEPAAREVGI